MRMEYICGPLGDFKVVGTLRLRRRQTLTGGTGLACVHVARIVDT